MIDATCPMVKEIHKIDGETQRDTNNDGLIDNITSSTGTTLYGYDLSLLNNISEITVDRDGIRRIYDRLCDDIVLFSGLNDSIIKVGMHRDRDVRDERPRRRRPDHEVYL